jgi:4-hydroxybenzoate polyprenyltransferase
MSLLTLLKLVRAPAGITAISNIVAAATIASNGQLNASLILLITSSILFYYSGMTLNDCFDFKEDSIERPSRPIPSGELSLKSAWIFGASMMLGGLVLAFLHSQTAGIIGLCLGAVIVLYNGLIKNGFAGSVCMASCRYFNWVLGATFVGLAGQNWLMALPIFFYIIGLTYLSKQETHGENKNAVFFCAFMLLLTALSGLYFVFTVFMLEQWQTYISVALIVVWSVLNVNKLIKVFKEFTPNNIQNLISWMVIGVIPLDALFVALSGHYIIALVILALLPPCRLLNKYLYVT